MSARLLDGQFHADNVLARVKANAARFDPPPHLALVQVGDDPASTRYVERKVKAGAEAGLTVDAIRAGSMQEARAALAYLAQDDDVHGIVLQLPVPDGMDTEELIALIPLAKDVDGLRADSPYGPATALAVEELLDREDIQLEGATVAIVGAHGAVGRQLAARWKTRGCVLLLADIDTPDLGTVTRAADILISATGSPGLITPELVKHDAAVIDVGFSFVDGNIRGDVDPRVSSVASALSPVPGGIGPLTVACLLRNVITAAQNLEPRT